MIGTIFNIENIVLPFDQNMCQNIVTLPRISIFNIENIVLQVHQNMCQNMLTPPRLSYRETPILLFSPYRRVGVPYRRVGVAL